MTLRSLMQAGPAKANELFAKLFRGALHLGPSLEAATMRAAKSRPSPRWPKSAHASVADAGAPRRTPATLRAPSCAKAKMQQATLASSRGAARVEETQHGERSVMGERVLGFGGPKKAPKIGSVGDAGVEPVPVVDGIDERQDDWRQGETRQQPEGLALFPAQSAGVREPVDPLLEVL